MTPRGITPLRPNGDTLVCVYAYCILRRLGLAHILIITE
jgi:hypothetical protein